MSNDSELPRKRRSMGVVSKAVYLQIIDYLWEEFRDDIEDQLFRDHVAACVVGAIELTATWVLQQPDLWRTLLTEDGRIEEFDQWWRDDPRFGHVEDIA